MIRTVSQCTNYHNITKGEGDARFRTEIRETVSKLDTGIKKEKKEREEDVEDIKKSIWKIIGEKDDGAEGPMKHYTLVRMFAHKIESS